MVQVTGSATDRKQIIIKENRRAVASKNRGSNKFKLLNKRIDLRFDSNNNFRWHRLFSENQ